MIFIDLATFRNEISRLPRARRHRAEHLLQMIFIMYKVYIVRVDDEDGAIRVVPEMMIVTFDEIAEVIAFDVPFHRTAPHLNPAQERLHVRLQINHEIRLRQVLGHGVRHGVIHRKFALGKILRGENAVLLKSVIADDQMMEQVVLHDRVLELVQAGKPKEYLRLKREGSRVLVELREERILRELLFHEIRRRFFRTDLREGRLAHADDYILLFPRPWMNGYHFKFSI